MVFPLGNVGIAEQRRGELSAVSVPVCRVSQSRTVLRGPEQHGADNHCQQSEAICSGLDF